MTYDVTYFIPWEGSDTIFDLTVEEVIKFLHSNRCELNSDIRITPSDNPSYTSQEFMARFGSLKE